MAAKNKFKSNHGTRKSHDHEAHAHPGIHTPVAMDVVYCQREFGRAVTFWGGLGSQSTIPCGNPAQVHAEAERMLALFSLNFKG
ncbi:MAG: hypothetical protein WCS31_08040 [Verrucomicrobiae bacterium]